MPSDEFIDLSSFFAHDTDMLPAGRFFEPTTSFGAWMTTQFDGVPIWDVGAGAGHIARELHERGMRVIAIDILARANSVFHVYNIDGAAAGYNKGSVVMLCRPCHGYFPDAVIRQAISCRVGAIVYVGLPKNVKTDLGKYRKNFKMECAKVGLNGERIYVWRTQYLKQPA